MHKLVSKYSVPIKGTFIIKTMNKFSIKTKIKKDMEVRKMIKRVPTCVNCKACYLRCPNQAIEYLLEDGFEMAYINPEKCIDCNACKGSCPSSLQKEPNISVEPHLLRLRNEKELMLSTSGAFFGELARDIIKNDGIVYGAAFNNDFSVSHKRVDDLQNLLGLFKSKYVQSELDNIFMKVEEDVKKGAKVLFSGTACQISGLKKYLNKDYPNLITIDLICKGVPPNDIWQKYLTELQTIYKSKIKKVDFRYYNKEDLSKIFFIEFDNGDILNEPLYANPYGKAYLTNVLHNKACFECKFKNFKNQSDITIADAWGYNNEEYDKVSLVLINSNKGKNAYNQISNSFMIFDDYEAESLLVNNYPILHPSVKHSNSDYILREYKNAQNIINLLECSADPFYSIKGSPQNVGILNFHYENYNYGANLVAYSLSKAVEKLGYSPYIINFDPFPELDSINRYRTFEMLKFRQRYLKTTPKISEGKDLKMLNEYFDNFIVGSDQVWRKVITNENYLSYFFDFVKWDKSAISYGASFGHDKFEGNELETKECEVLIKKFAAISVREKSGQKICKDLFNVNSNIVLDPTLLLTAKDYEEIMDEKKNNSGYIAYYCLFDQEPEFLNDMKRLFPRKEYINIKGHNENINLINREVFTYETVGNWIQGIKNSEFVITDSYHGVLFSILYNKNYICLGGSSASKSRFDNIFEILQGNTETRMFKSLNEIENVQELKMLDYKSINENLEKYRKQSMEFLRNNIGKTKKYDAQEIQYIIEYFNELSNKNANELNKLIQENENLQNLNMILTEEKENLQKIKSILTEDNEKLNQILAETEQSLSSVMSSRSWRVTAPLRKTTNVLKKYIKKK